MSLSVDEIRDLAREAHAGQRDMQGRDYFDAHLTPIASALALFGDQYEALGWLHDIVEDTDYTYDRLRAEGVDREVVDGVRSMTRSVSPATGRPEPYATLIQRSAAHRLGRRGKLVDGAWNIACNHGLALVDPIRADSMLNGRYLPARRVLLAADSITGAEIRAVDLVLDEHLTRLASAHLPDRPAA